MLNFSDRAVDEDWVGMKGDFISADCRATNLTGSQMKKSTVRSSVCNSLAIATIISLSILATGCSTLTSTANREVPVAATTAATAPNGTYTVEMHPHFGEPIQYKGTLTGSTTVAEALELSGSIKKFRAMEVEILRIVEHKGRSRGLRMPVTYERNSKGPTPEQNYALLDGDRVVVKPQGGIGVTKLISAAIGAN